MGAEFQLPLQQVIPGQLIASALWNGEFNNISTNFIPAGMDSYSDTDAQMQIQTAPYPGSVTSHATNLGGELERIRFMIASITGNTFWYQAPTNALNTGGILPIGGVMDYPSATPPNANWHLADGTAINRTIYATLFSLMGTAFGAGDASTTFNLPNYTDRMSIAAGNLYALAATGGASTHTLINSEVPVLTDPGHNHIQNAHSHGITDPSHTHVQNVIATQTGSAGHSPQDATVGTVSKVASDESTGASATGLTVNAATAINQSSLTGISYGGGTSHNILNPYLAMYKMIRVL